MNPLLRHAAVSYLLLIMLLKMALGPLAMLDYILHRDFITAHFCENKTRPEIHCFGKCYLRKQLSKAGETADSRGQQTVFSGLGIDIFQLLPEYLLSPPLGTQACSYPLFTLQIPSPAHPSVFHPPAA
jgi:hypothetical protein